MKETTMQIQAIAHADVRGKEMLYLKVKHGGNDVLINIGKKTYDSIIKLSEEPIKQPIKKEETK